MLVQFETKQGDKLKNGKGDAEILGGFHMRILPLIMAPTYFVVVIITYYVAAILNSEIKPFPNCTITGSATPFPQNILFRAVILTQFGSIVAMYLTQYYMFKTIIKKAQQSGRMSMSKCCEEFCTPKWINILASVGIILIAIAVCTICAGYMNDTIHGASAVGGFFILYVTMIMIVVVYNRLKPYGDILISETSLKAKTYVVGVMTAIFGYIVYLTVTGQPYSDADTGYLEYSVYYTLVFFFATFIWDYKNYYYFWSLSDIKKNDLVNNPIVNTIPVLYEIPVPQQQVQQVQQSVCNQDINQQQQKDMKTQEIQMQTLNQQSYVAQPVLQNVAQPVIQDAPQQQYYVYQPQQYGVRQPLVQQQ